VILAEFVQIATGNWHSLGIKSDGTLWAWGQNSTGQLGDGTTTNRTSPVQIGTDNTWSKIAAGGTHSLGIKSDGTLWAWGRNGTGQLGDGTITAKLAPVQIGVATDWSQISGGQSHSLGIKDDGTLWAWGRNNIGQLGDGTTTQRTTPRQIGTATNWSQVDAGNDFSMGLKSDGTRWGWGTNNGAFGDCGITHSTTPRQTDALTNWIKIAAGYSYGLGLKSDGTLWGWGTNSSGQLGDGTIIDKSCPTQVGTETNWSNISAGYAHSLGVKSDGTLWAWGRNLEGQLGDGTTTERRLPVFIWWTDNFHAKTWSRIDAGGYHSMGIRGDGTLWVWGLNTDGQLGDGSVIQRNRPVKTHQPVINSTKTVLIFGTAADFIGITDGQEVCSGSGTITLTADNITTGVFSGVGVTDNANGTATFNPATAGVGDHSISYQVNVGFVQVAAGQNHSLGIRSDGSLWAWGFNGNGELGDGTTTNRQTPVIIGGGTWSQIAAGMTHSLGIKSDGTLWAWGSNIVGELGDGTTINRTLPVQIGTASDWIQISAGGYYSLGLKSDGTLWGWGGNGSGTLGDGTSTGRTSPAQTGTDTWSQIAAGRNHGLGIKSDGTLWAWGENFAGAIGDGTTTGPKYTPVQIGTDTWSKIAAGRFHSLGIKNNGTLWAWGYNNYGQLGDGTTTTRYSPVQIASSTTWSQIASTNYHSMGVRTDGYIFTWGYNNRGQLGAGTTTNRLSPQTLYDGCCYNQIAAGGEHSLGIKSDGSLWAWGWNNWGQIGDGGVTQRNSPVKISDPVVFTSTKIVSVVATPTADAPSNVTACDSYILPALTVGNYYTATNGGGTLLNAGENITSTQTLYVYATNGSCSDEKNFTVTITTTPTADAPSNVAACDNYILPALTVGNYYTATNGGGTLLNAGASITSSQTLYVYATNGSCSDEKNFTVTITTTPTADAPSNVSACDSYILPSLTVGNYFTATNGGGTPLSAGATITSSQTLYVYAVNTCGSDEKNFTVTITTTPTADAPSNVAACDSYILPALTVGNYFTATNGGGTLLNAGDNITSTQTLYVYATNGSCSDENSFDVTITNTPSADAPSNVAACDSYILPALTVGNYYTATNGGGTLLNAGDNITSTQTLYVYATSGSCSDENSFEVSITTTPTADAPSNVSVCDSYTLPALTVGNYYTATNGGGTPLSAGASITSTQTLYVYATNGSCSDENSFDVTINNSPANTVTVSGNTLTANESGAIYQWLDCDNGNAPINDADAQSYTVSASGNYAVEVTKGGCISTSSCTLVSFVGINENSSTAISVYPNPSTGKFTVIAEQLGKNYRVTDNIGKVVAEGTINNTQTDIDLSNSASGLYLLTIEGHVYKLVKQ
jgi:alpha-tubulin suppressor-like RCC1 family protein